MKSTRLMKTVWRVIVITLGCIAVGGVVLSGCSSAPPTLPAATKSARTLQPIPPVSQFKMQAVGTLLPPGTSYAQTLNLPAGSSGVLFINKTGRPVSVAVTDTIATIPVGQIYLFVLPPDRYEFYLYGVADVPISQIEQTEFEKTRYVYLIPFNSQKPAAD
jgi:hypothetical protein